MIRKSGLGIILASFAFVLLGCPNINTATDPVEYDPDPVESPETPVDPVEDLYIVANLAGHVAGFWSSDPEAYTILATDASTEEYLSDIRISPDLKHLLYARENGDETRDLMLVDLVDQNNNKVLVAGISTNESEFIDNDTLQYSYNARIHRYTISTEEDIILFTGSYNCNHGGQVSPDGTRLVFKNQDPSSSLNPERMAQVVWADTIPANIGIAFYEREGFDLFEPFYFNWRDNSRVIFKPNPDDAYRVFQKNLDTGASNPAATMIYDSSLICFSKLLISPDRQNLLLYGNKGVYILDLSSHEDITGNIEVDEVYQHPDFTTRFAAIGSESKSFVVGTYNWMGIYNIEGLEKTSVSMSNITDIEGVLYGLHCR